MTSREQEEKIIEEIKELVPLFLKTNESDIELSKRTGISASTVGRRLTDSRIREIFSTATFAEIQIRRQDNLDKGKERGRKISMDNSNYTTIKKPTRHRLSLFYVNEKDQMNLLVSIALTYRAKLPLLAEFFDIPKEELEKKLAYEMRYNKAIDYLFNHEFICDQELAKVNLENFYNTCYTNARRENKEALQDAMRDVRDMDVKELIKNHTNGAKYTDEEFAIIVKHQLKYALNQDEISSLFGIQRKYYSSKVLSYLEKYPELKQRYEALASYNYYLYNKASERKSDGRNR